MPEESHAVPAGWHSILMLAQIFLCCALQVPGNSFSWHPSKPCTEYLHAHGGIQCISEGYKEGLFAKCHGLESCFELFCFVSQNCKLQLYDFSSREGCMEFLASEHVFSQAT